MKYFLIQILLLRVNISSNKNPSTIEFVNNGTLPKILYFINICLTVYKSLFVKILVKISLDNSHPNLTSYKYLILYICLDDIFFCLYFKYLISSFLNLLKCNTAKHK